MEEPTGLVYLIRNRITGKKYVGQTIHNIKERWRKHCLTSSNCKVLKRAIIKYGAKAFEVSTLESGLPRRELNEREKYWIGELKTRVPLGYNLLDGGNSTDLVNTSRSKKRKATLAALAARGLPKGKSPLTESDVTEIFRLYESGESQKILAENFGVHKSTISHIIEGKNWSHLGLSTTRLRTQKVISEDQAIEALRLNSLEIGSKKISKLVGISVGSVNRVLRGCLFPGLQGKFGERRYVRRGVQTSIIIRIKYLRDMGWSCPKIGKELGINQVTAWKYCK